MFNMNHINSNIKLSVMPPGEKFCMNDRLQALGNVNQYGRHNIIIMLYYY